jgi:protease IV
MLATIAGIVALQVVGFVLFLIFISIASAGSDAPKVEENTVLVAKFNKSVTDRADNNPMSQFLSGNFGMDGSMGLDQVLKDIEKAKTDENIKGIFMRLSAVPIGMASLEEIRDALVDFKESGKFIISHSDTYTHKSYYLASVSDSIYLTPTGNLGFSGLSAQVMFYKRAMEKYGVDMQVIRHGKFKSAVEPYLAEKMSPENREQTIGYVSAIWNQMVSEISIARGISEETLNEYADELAVSFDDQALEKGMIDGLKYYDEILDELKERTEISEDEDVRGISLSKYIDVPSTEKKEATRDKIAVIYAMGIVVPGDSGEGTIGSDRIAKAIRKARKDDKVKAIVFRVNSGGGSALASEIIYREAKLAAEAKPFVASLGNVAASGGYYIVCPADTIVASETTITGSIGVFGRIPNLQELLNDKIGITTDGVKTNKHSDLGSIYRPLDPDERAFIQEGVDDVYIDFVNRVAEGRGMSFEDVDAIGEGRVWAGKDAIEIGLVDVFGGLEKSIEIAAEMAGLENYRISSRPELDDPFTSIMKQFSGDVKTKIMKKELGEAYDMIKQAQEIEQMKGVQAMMPYTVKIY